METEKINGILGSIKEAENEDTNGRWKKRASFKVGDTILGTFDGGVDEILKAVDSEVELEYTPSNDGRYKNYVKGSLKMTGSGEVPVTETEDIVNSTTASTIPYDVMSNAVFSANTTTPVIPKKVKDYQEADCDKYSLGMAINSAAAHISRKLVKENKEWGSTAEVEYVELVAKIFDTNKTLRKELLGK